MYGAAVHDAAVHDAAVHDAAVHDAADRAAERPVEELCARIERLLADVGAADPAAGTTAEALVAALVELYGEGLTRVVDALHRSGEPGRRVLAGLAADDLVAGLLLLHGLHPDDVDTRVQKALDRVRPYLGSHTGGVRYLGVDEDAVAHLELEGTCSGCPSSTVTAKLTLERAVLDAAPEVEAVDVIGVSAPPGTAGPSGSPLLQIGRPDRTDRPNQDRCPAVAAAPALQPLRARSAAPATPPVVERCDMCGEPVPANHRHVVDVEQRALLCCCTACSLLFEGQGAGSGRYRAVPDRYLRLSPSVVTQARWDKLAIPVGTAFFFRSSATGRMTCFYPSPAGATESLLDMDVWEEFAAAEPALAGIAPDVEALLVTRAAGPAPADGLAGPSRASGPAGPARASGPAGPAPAAASSPTTGPHFDAFLLPVDACYELVGLLRRHWKGLDGGEQVREQSDRFFAGVTARCAQESLEPAR